MSKRKVYNATERARKASAPKRKPKARKPKADETVEPKTEG